jgi:ABC-type multidrug transport system ATPase subunit
VLTKPERLEKIYHAEIEAVNGRDLSIPENSIYAFLSPIGAGKTTIN